MSRDFKAESLAEKQRQIEANPCFEEQKKSLICLQYNANDFEDKCFREIQNTKICQTFWFEIKKFRALNDIRPHIPTPEDRPHIKQLYLKTGSLKPIFEEMKRQYDL